METISNLILGDGSHAFSVLPWVVPLITAVGSIASNAISTGMRNRAERRAWNEMNQYNSPSMQMKRFQEAGLNPHLVYGSSAGGAAGNAGSPRNVESANLDNSFMTNMAQFVGSLKSKADMAVSEKQLQVMDSQIAQNMAQTASTIQSTATNKFQLAQAVRLKDTVVEQAEATLNNTRLHSDTLEASVDKILAETGAVTQGTKESKQRVLESKQRIMESAQRIRNMKLDGNLKGIQIEIEKVKRDLWNRGQSPNDPAWQRVLGNVIEDIWNPSDKTDKNVLQLLWDWIRY